MPLTDPPCLALLFKHPSRSKTRLAHALGGKTRPLAALLLSCAEEDLAEWDGPICVAPAEDRDLGALERLMDSRPDCMVVPQVTGNLGTRINRLDQSLRGRGVDAVLMIGSDCPGLAGAHLQAAAKALDDQPFVVCPALDGGLALMGNGVPWPSLSDLPWSTGQLGEAVLAACAAQGHAVKQLVTLRDVDSMADLISLRAELAGDSRPSRRSLKTWINQHLP